MHSQIYLKKAIYLIFKPKDLPLIYCEIERRHFKNQLCVFDVVEANI